MVETSGRQPPIITLTTDFGLQDEYVGSVKGVLLRYCRDAVLVDVTHHIAPHDVVQAAMTIGAAYPYFPRGTVHLTVVDPGVGSDRQILAVRACGHLFVAPDNGILTPILRAARSAEVFQVVRRDLFAEVISSSFHGRDIMAPVAARLAGGMDLGRVGPRISSDRCRLISLPAAVRHGNSIIGEVIHIDHFGNLRTSITAADLAHIPPNAHIVIAIGDRTLSAIGTTYTTEAKIVALVDSRNHLEIAVSGGNAARELKCRMGEKIVCRFFEPEHS